MSDSLEDIQQYYDLHVGNKLRGFVEGNARVERAWSTITAWAPQRPGRILEVGCGIGDLSWRMAHVWPSVEVTGLDISAASLAVAEKLFASERIAFRQGPLKKGALDGKMDLVVLIDVYEHIARADRPLLHAAIRELMDDGSRIILSFPTPRHLEWLRRNKPSEIQPVDEDISIATISALASETATDVLFYQEVDIWHHGDYAHAVLGRQRDFKPVDPHVESRPRAGVLKRLWPSKPASVLPSREERLAKVRERLGADAYKPA